MKLLIQLFCFFSITTGFCQITFAPPQQNPFLLNDNGKGQSAPFFTDLTNNGKLNIITGTSNGELAYYINVGNTTAPLFPTQQLNYANLDVLVDFSAPVAVDLDNDGDFDILAGDSTGNFYYESNIGNNTFPNFGLAPQVNPFGLFDIGGYTHPTMADLDNDGDFDLLTGTQNGNYIYFENTGSVSNPAFSPQGTNPFGLVGIGNNGFTAPEFVDIDGDGDFDLISGSNGGEFRFYENIGSATAPAFASAILNPFGLTNVGFLSSAAFGDLDRDGDLDMLAGENAGNYYYFENTSPLCTVNIPDTTFKNLLLANTALNTNGDQEIQCFEAQSYTGTISASNNNITNITGIETFTNATQINITNTAITNADLSNNTAATIFILNDNTSLASLDLGTNTNLVNLSVNQTGLTELNISGVVNLTDLQIAGTSFTTLDVSSNGNLAGLLLNNSAITTIDVTANTLLNSFTALNSSLTSIDLSNNTQLATFRVFGSQNLSSVDLRNGTNITTLNPNNFDARNTPNLTCISVDDVGYAVANYNLIDAGDVFSLDCNAPVCIVSIPDNNFKASLVGNTAINTNGDSEIQCTEASAYTGAINISSQSIMSILGIEAFVNATSLDASVNGITTANLTSNTALTSINLASNSNFSQISLGSNLNLLDLNLNFTNLSSIDLTNVPNLEVFTVVSPNLPSLDVSQNSALKSLSIGTTSITSLDISNNTALELLFAPNLAVGSLDVSANSALKELNIPATQITSIDVSNLFVLEILKLDFNNISNLDLSNNTSLKELRVSNTQLTILDLSNNPNLEKFNASANLNLTSIDLRNGNNTNITTNFYDTNSTPNLLCVNVDEVGYATTNWTFKDPVTVFSLDCSVTLNQAPIAICQNLTLTLDATGNATITASDLDGGSTDTDGTITSLQASQTNFDCSNVGTNNIILTVTDDDGATNTCTAIVIVEDTIAPEIGIPPVLTFTTDPGTCFANPGFLLGASDACGIATVSSNAPADGNYPVGNTNVTITATDINGNTNSQTFTVTVQDNEPPSIDTPANIILENDAGLCTASASFLISSSDNCGVSSTTTDAPSGNIFPLGTTTVTITAIDVNGNVSTDSFTVTVNDTEAPILTVPEAIIVNNSPGICGAVVPFTANATDNCSTPSIINDIPSGNLFPVGSTLVTFTATDANGNTTSLTSTVTVEDNELPMVSCPSNQVISVNQGDMFSIPDYIATGNVTASDNCTLFSTLQIPTPGTMVGAGNYTIEIEATDDSGNVAICMFELEIDELLSNQVNTVLEYALYPNPAQNFIYIESNQIIEKTIIYTLTGKKVIISKDNSISISHLSNGIYIAEVVAKNGTKNISKFIKE